MLATVPFWTESYTPAAVRPARRVPDPVLAARMLDELLINRLEVVLVPDRQYAGYGAETRRLRCAVSINAPWYRAFCGRYESNRRGCFAKFKTKIKRRETAAALVRLLAHWRQMGEATAPPPTPYVERLLEFIGSVRADPQRLRRYGLDHEEE